MSFAWSYNLLILVYKKYANLLLHHSCWKVYHFECLYFFLKNLKRTYCFLYKLGRKWTRLMDINTGYYHECFLTSSLMWCFYQISTGETVDVVIIAILVVQSAFCSIFFPILFVMVYITWFHILLWSVILWNTDKFWVLFRLKSF